MAGSDNTPRLSRACRLPTVVLLAQRVPEIHSALVAGLPVREDPFALLGDLLTEHAAYGVSDHPGNDREYWRTRMEGAPEPVGLSGRRPGGVTSLLHRTDHLDGDETVALRASQSVGGLLAGGPRRRLPSG